MTDQFKFDPDKISTAIEQLVRSQTPSPDNKCACGGQIVCKVTGLFHGKFCYSIPHCQACSRVYFLAENVPTVGEKEFLNLLRQPFTI